MTIGAKLVTETVDLIIENNGNIDTVPQESFYEDSGELHSAPKIYKDTCRINWEQTTGQIYDFIRGLSPYPAAWTEFLLPEGGRIPVKIFQSEKLDESHSLPPGTIRTDGKQSIDVATKDGFIRIRSLRLSGKKRMSAKEFLNGNRVLRAN
jgi:methionyl-tRNA formyltransferase